MNDIKRIIIVIIGVVFLSLFAFSIKNHMDSVGYKNQVKYTTAVKAIDKERFNYSIDSKQGRLLATGELSAKGDLARFSEMTKGFSYVERTKEHYTMHTREVCTGSGKTESCHTEVYYTWDYAGSESLSIKKVSLFDREYDANLFNFGNFKQRANACDITVLDKDTGIFSEKHGCSKSWFGGEYYYLDDDDRYTYDVVPTKLTATFLASTYNGLKPLDEDKITLQNKNIDQVLKDVGKYKLVGFWTLVSIMSMLFIAACVGAYAWVMQDGEFSLDR